VTKQCVVIGLDELSNDEI